MGTVKPSLREIFADAAEIAESAARAAFLDHVCQGDAALRARVEKLLQADATAGDFLQNTGDTTTAEMLSEKAGDRIGRYRLIERIGRGGGGVVYLAEQEEPVRRRVALKILKLGMDTQSFIARFEAERQALAMMDHPNIARVLDAGATDKGRPFFVMELVSGQRLSDYCISRRLPLRQRLELFISVCHAVQHAHQKGIIHRDLKPSNILVTEHEGVALPKVIDFGIAKATAPESIGSGDMTTACHLLGTPAYMSPEQTEMGKQDIDTRADIYSLGVVLYELLTGRPPFEMTGTSIDEIRHLIRDVDPVRPSTRIKTISNRPRSPSPPQFAREHFAALRGDLDWIVMKCLEKDRARRYQTANGLASDIRRHLENEPVLARPPSQLYLLQKVVRRHRMWFGAAGAVALVLISAVIVSTQLALRAQRAEKEQGRLRAVAETRADESRQLLTRRYVAEGNRLVEQGRPLTALPWLVEALELETGNPARESDERLRIAQSLLGAPELRLQFAQGKWVNCVALNSNGSLLASGSDDGTIRISDVATGGVVANVALHGAIGHVQFSPDGTRLVAADMTGQARVWDAASGQALTPLLLRGDSEIVSITNDDGLTGAAQNSAESDDAGESSIADTTRRRKPTASFSPDGKFLLLASNSKSAQLRDATTGALLHKFTHPDTVYHATFSPDGRYVATSSKDATARVWDVTTGQPAGPSMQHAGIVVWAQFSLDSSQLLTVRDDHDVQLWDWRQGRKLGQEIPRRSVLSFAGLSRDGVKIVTTAQSGYANVYDAASSLLLYGFDYQGGLVDAALSPAGNGFAVACHDGNVWIRDGSDSASEPIVLPEGNQIEEIAFSGDGRFLAVGTRGGRARVWELSPPPRDVRRLPGNDVQWVEFDPSGRRALVVSSDAKDGVGIYDTQTGNLVAFAATKLGEVKRASFSPDGRRVLALGKAAVLVLDAESGREVFPPLKQGSRLVDAIWSPDGKYILTAAGEAGAQAWDSATGKLALTFPASEPVTALAISSDGTRLATAQADKRVQFWEAPAGRRVAESVTVPGKISELQFSPDGKWLAIATDPAPGRGNS